MPQPVGAELNALRRRRGRCFRDPNGVGIERYVKRIGCLQGEQPTAQ